MRGFGLNQGYRSLVITVDGRRLNNIDLSPQNLSSVPLGNIERIEITKGSGSVIYGDSAMAGAIHIFTKKNLENKSWIDTNYHASGFQPIFLLFFASTFIRR